MLAALYRGQTRRFTFPFRIKGKRGSRLCRFPVNCPIRFCLNRLRRGSCRCPFKNRSASADAARPGSGEKCSSANEYLLPTILYIERPSPLISTICDEGLTRLLIKNSCFVLAPASRCLSLGGPPKQPTPIFIKNRGPGPPFSPVTADLHETPRNKRD